MKQKENNIICQKCKERPATHCHYLHWKEKPLSRKHRVVQKDNPELFEDLCAICHAKVHNISPRMSELKRLVVLRDRTIKQKNVLGNQIYGLGNIELRIPDDWTEEYDKKVKQIRIYKREIKKLVKVLPRDRFPLMFALGEKGIAETTIAKIITSIDNPLDESSKTKNFADLKRICGLDPTRIQRPKKITQKQAQEYGKPYLKKEMFLLVEGFIKHKNPNYTPFYYEIKEKEIALAKKFGYNTVIPNTNPPKTTVRKGKSHAHVRACRRVAQAFLRDLLREWKALECIEGEGDQIHRVKNQIIGVPSPSSHLTVKEDDLGSSVKTRNEMSPPFHFSDGELIE